MKTTKDQRKALSHLLTLTDYLGHTAKKGLRDCITDLEALEKAREEAEAALRGIFSPDPGSGVPELAEAIEVGKGWLAKWGTRK
jgi:hypothetical protein